MVGNGDVLQRVPCLRLMWCCCAKIIDLDSPELPGQLDLLQDRIGINSERGMLVAVLAKLLSIQVVRTDDIGKLFSKPVALRFGQWSRLRESEDRLCATIQLRVGAAQLLEVRLVGRRRTAARSTVDLTSCVFQFLCEEIER